MNRTREPAGITSRIGRGLTALAALAGATAAAVTSVDSPAFASTVTVLGPPDVSAYCVHVAGEWYSPAVMDRYDAYSWICVWYHSPGHFFFVDMDEACALTYNNPFAYGAALKQDDPYSWECRVGDYSG